MSGRLFNSTISIEGVETDTDVDVDTDLNERFDNLLDNSIEEAPRVDGEVVEWMQEAGSHNRILSPWANDWDSAGGAVEAMSNDGWYPGTITESYQIFRRQQGKNIQSAGFVRIDDREGEKVGETPAFDRGWFADKSGFAINITNFNVQHNTLLAEIKEYPKIPYEGSIRTGTVPVQNRGRLSFPVVFEFGFLRPALQATFDFKVRSPQAGTMAVEFWNSQRQVTDKQEVTLQEGGQSVSVSTRGSPVVRGGYINLLFDGFEQAPTVSEIDSFPISL